MLPSLILEKKIPINPFSLKKNSKFVIPVAVPSPKEILNLYKNCTNC